MAIVQNDIYDTGSDSSQSEDNLYNKDLQKIILYEQSHTNPTTHEENRNNEYFIKSSVCINWPNFHPSKIISRLRDNKSKYSNSNIQISSRDNS